MKRQITLIVTTGVVAFALMVGDSMFNGHGSAALVCSILMSPGVYLLRLTNQIGFASAYSWLDLLVAMWGNWVAYYAIGSTLAAISAARQAKQRQSA